ncbi:hypothetical protein [Pseudomonas citronellolis]|nr:hypothetical protein [Pseudomonas citronellolis]AMO78041.1 hypothetical protein PcP3B5_46490 [Pseudomonas citronellolis]
MNDMNDMNDEIELSAESESVLLEALSATEGAVAAICALAISLKRAGAIDEALLDEKVEKFISNTSGRPILREPFERPLRLLQWALSDQSSDAERRIFGDQIPGQAPTPPGE